MVTHLVQVRNPEHSNVVICVRMKVPVLRCTCIYVNTHALTSKVRTTRLKSVFEIIVLGTWWFVPPCRMSDSWWVEGPDVGQLIRERLEEVEL